MSETRGRVAAGDFTATDPEEVSWALQNTAPPILLCVVNELDVQVNAQVYLTHHEDTAFDYASLAAEFTMLGGSGTPADGDGETASDMLTEPWERMKVTVTPASSPSAGELTVRTMTGDR